jgi:hypothetical protein
MAVGVGVANDHARGEPIKRRQRREPPSSKLIQQMSKTHRLADGFQ